MPAAGEREVSPDAENVRATAKMCVQKTRLGDCVEAMCPPDVMRLLALPQVVAYALRFAHNVHSQYPALRHSPFGEDDLMQELVERYGEGRRLYRWHHWCEDMVPPQWLHLVECRLIGSRATANASVMRSIAAGEAVKIRGGMYRAEDGADDGDHEVSSSDKVIDLDRYDFSDDYEEVDRAVRLALADRPELIHGAIQECAARGGIDPYGAKALDVYLELYDDPSGKVPPKRKRSQIAVRHGVSKAFVEEMAVTDALWWSLATHCSKGTIDQICDAILMRLPDPGRGSKNGPE